MFNYKLKYEVTTEYVKKLGGEKYKGITTINMSTNPCNKKGCVNPMKYLEECHIKGGKGSLYPECSEKVFKKGKNPNSGNC